VWNSPCSLAMRQARRMIRSAPPAVRRDKSRVNSRSMVTTTAQFGDAPGYAEIGAAVPAVVFGGGDEICHVSSSREEKTGRLPQRGFIGYLRVIPTSLKSP
jgi:hypothetical protein